MPHRLCAALIAFAVWIAPALLRAEPLSGAVILAYTRFGEDQYPSNSIRLDQFEAHIEELLSADYTVLPLPRIVEALRRGEPLPDRTVAITIDGAWRSAYLEAFPRLQAAGLPFTLFVPPETIDRRAPGHVTWSEIREMARAGVAIGAMSLSFQPMPLRPLNDVRGDLHDLRARFITELGREPTLFAYANGEYSLAVREVVRTLGFAAAFGQQSGVAYGGGDLFSLPRFVMNEAFGGIDRFRLAANALPLPVDDVTPDDPAAVTNPPNLGFTVADEVGDLSRLACFASGQGRMRLEWAGDNRVEARATDPFPPSRARINCTLPAAEGRWRWFGVQFFVP